ncbi:MAG: protease complex subunit PrcB family protein [Spirochaetaceae bacterium]|nr:MAG: protease complex subunit PrcB family protein [Spirochaetaceae bacterium]
MRAAALIVGALLLSACATFARQGEPIDFSTVDRGTHSGIEQAGCCVIQTNEQFAALWAELYRTRHPEPPMPVVDFDHEVVVAVFQGRQPSGGYAVEVQAVRRIGRRAVVHVAQTVPEPGDMVTMALTAPYHVVRFTRPESGVIFCGSPAGQGGEPAF